MVQSAALADDPTAACLTIDLEALVANYHFLAHSASPARAAANVKADAYGLGIGLVVPALYGAGCRDFFVATLSEGLKVRAHAHDATIYVLNGFPSGSAPFYLNGRLSAVLGSREEISEFEAAFKTHPQLMPPALHIDTGMNRLGLTVDEAEAYARERHEQSAPLPLSLIMTHFVESEVRHSPVTPQQIDIFEKTRSLFSGVAASLSNSSACLYYRDFAQDLIRPGYALYGGNPTPDMPNPMRPVIRLEAPIIQIRTVPAGTRIGYGGEFTTNRKTTIATLSLGYADGYPRGAKTTDHKAGASCLIAGQSCPVLGRVSMDLIMVDITDCPSDEVKRGTMALVIGDEMTLDDLAAKSDTIGYELLVHLGSRFRRRIVNGRE